MYPYFESIRCEGGQLQNLEYHQKRVAIHSQVILAECVEQLDTPSEGVHKLRISYNQSSFGDVQICAYKPKEINTLRLIECNEIEYSTKNNDRATINQLYDLKGQADDILIVKNGLITDSSFSNILLFDGSGWITPKSYLLRGTCRERLLEQGIIREQTVRTDDLKSYASFMLVNAMLDFDLHRALSTENIIHTF